jgi:hypothetical protein
VTIAHRTIAGKHFTGRIRACSKPKPARLQVMICNPISRMSKRHCNILENLEMRKDVGIEDECVGMFAGNV